MSLRQLLRPKNMSDMLKMTRYYHPSNCGRALMGDTNVQEQPKNYFLYIYNFDVQPDALCGVRYPEYQAFVKQHTFAFENFSFRYEGEWWDIGSTACNLLWFLAPLIILVLRFVEDGNSKQLRATQTKFYSVSPGVPFMSFNAFTDKGLL